MKATRRQFLQVASSVGLLKAQAAKTSRFAYLGGDSAVQVFSIAGERWNCIQTVASKGPGFLALDSRQKTLYVVNQVDEHDGLPRGTVEAFCIEGLTGRLSLLSRTPLSLSATGPRHLAISPGGGHLIVAAYKGGVLNVLPIAPDGSLSNPVHIFKEVGCSEHPEHQAGSHPYSVVFDPAGRHVLVSDVGCDRLTAFALESGRLVRRFRISVRPGDGPGPIAFHRSGASVSVTNLLNPSVSTYRYCAETGELGFELTRRVTPGTGAWSISGKALSPVFKSA